MFQDFLMSKISIKKTVLKRLFFISLFLPLILSNSVQAAEKINLHQQQIEARVIDPRAQILQEYLAQYNSPLQNHASSFVEAADLYNLDWKLVAAISGVESTFGKFVPGGTTPQYSSYNAWGWGVYGTQAIYFKSWREGIFTVSEGLRKNYFNKGLTNPYVINRVYAASPTWGSNVTYFLNSMNKFEKEYKKQNPYELISGLLPQTAGKSAQLAFNLP